jgi:hypothetical protein
MSLFDFSLINTTPNEVLQKYSEEQIYQHYWPQFQFGNACSPFRSDANPSFRIYNHRSSDWRIWWSDHKTGESGHVFQFVQKVYQLKGQRLSIPEICDKICEDLHDGEALAIQKPKEYKQAKRRNSKALGSTIIQAIQDPCGGIPDWALCYWERFGISQAVLDAYHVSFAAEIYLIWHNDEGQRISQQWGVSTKGNPIFYYFFPDTGHMKVYRPMERDKKRKWISNVNNLQDIQGWAQCMQSENHDLLILTKSLKDVMWLRTIGVDAMAIHGERHMYTKEQMELLRAKYKRIVSLYDNDWAGMRGGLKLREKWEVPCYFYPRSTGVKDTTDLYLKDYKQLFQFIQQFKAHLNADNNRYTAIGHAAVA